jgi:hypothetical protein
MTPAAGARVRRMLFALAVAICLVRPAIALLVELPRTPVARGLPAESLRRLYRPEHLDRIRAQAPEGDVFLGFELPESAAELAALLYYQCRYDLYPRRVLVTDRPVVINDGRDLLRAARAPDAAWLVAQGVRWRAQFRAEGGRLALAVGPVAPP